MNGYELSRSWFDWCFENPEKIKPNHTALYFFCIEHCNRMGWKEKFGLPTNMAKEAIGIKSYNTYSETLFDLVNFGFIKMVEKSKNQYSSNIIALSKFDKALDKALDKATIKHLTKQLYSKSESIDSIDKPLTNNLEQEEPQTDDRLVEKIELSKKILLDFGFTETTNFDKLRLISQFLTVIIGSGRFDYFKTQYNNYQLFKDRSKEKKHSLHSLLGTATEQWQNGAWDDSNWGQKLNEQILNDKPSTPAFLTAAN